MVSPLNSTLIHEAGTTAGSSTSSAELKKHTNNDAKCSGDLDWVCVPMAVDTYGTWGHEAQTTFSRLATRLAIKTASTKLQALCNLYSRMNITLVRANARAILSRTVPAFCTVLDYVYFC